MKQFILLGVALLSQLTYANPCITNYHPYWYIFTLHERSGDVVTGVGFEPQWCSLNDSDVDDLVNFLRNQPYKILELNLNNNNFTDKGIKQLIQAGLQYNFWSDYLMLNLSVNYLTDAVIPTLQKIHNMNELLIANNQISDRGICMLAQQYTLESLNISGTNVTDAGMGCLTYNRNLIKLTADNTAITDKGALSISTMTELKYLSLDNTQLSDQGACLIAPLPAVEILHLSRVKLTERGISCYSKNKKLRQINFADDNLNDASATILANLKQLEVAYLPDNNIGDDGAIAFANARAARDFGLDLTIDNNVITDVGAIAMSKKQFNSLHVQNNKIEREGVEALGEAFDKGNIRFLGITGNPGCTGNGWPC